MCERRLLKCLKTCSVMVAVAFATFVFLDESSTMVQLMSRKTADLGSDHSVRLVLDLESQPKDKTVLPARIKICVASAITSAKMGRISDHEVPQKFVFFSGLMPSFCETATDGFDYFFYLGHDQLDGFFNQTDMRSSFAKHFKNIVDAECSLDVRKHIFLKFIECPFNKKSAWAMNEAVMDGYLDEMDYFYRITDDITMQTKDWAPLFIDQLNQYDPPLVGVVGPNQTKGCPMILTHDFVHATHIDIFGFYFPRAFLNWYADHWITNVYRPKRSTKLTSVRIVHTMSLGQRYKFYDAKEELKVQKMEGQKVLDRYIKHRRNHSNSTQSDGTKVIAMSLYCNHSNFTMAAIRNAQLLPVILPGWQLWVYVADQLQCTPEHRISPRVIRKLGILEAKVIAMDPGDPTVEHMLPNEWNTLVANDPQVEQYLIRSVLPVLSEQDVAAAKL